MWVIEGPFDGKNSGEVEHKKTKLLKPDQSYLLGRKAKQPSQLIINHPKISAEHVTFTVAGHSLEDLSDPSMMPTVTIHNHKSKVIQIKRNEERILVNPSSEIVLEDGDIIALVTGVYVAIRWENVCCYVPPGSPTIPFKNCASLGIKIVSALSPQITHHLTPMLNTTSVAIYSMLLPAQLVRPDWLFEFLRLGDLVKEGSGSHETHNLTVLEYEFSTPVETKFRPSFAPTLPPDLKTFKIWEPNPERSNFLIGWRLIFLRDNGSELDSDVRAFIERGGGEYDTYDMAGGPTRLKQALLRNKRKAEGMKGISVLGDSEKLKVATGDLWDDMLETIGASGLRIIEQDDLSRAIILLNGTLIDSASGVSVEQESRSSRPSDVAPVSIAQQEPVEQQESLRSEASGSKPRLRRTRASSRAATPATERAAETARDSVPETISEDRSVPTEEQEAPRRKKPLVRRVRAGTKVLLGVDDPSVIDSQPPDTFSDQPPATAATMESVPPVVIDSIPPRPSRLKRRLRSQTPMDSASYGVQKQKEVSPVRPPLKKFRALFEETDPDRIPGSDIQNLITQSGGIVDDGESQVPSQLITARDKPSIGTTEKLHAIAEESEESLLPGGATQAGHSAIREVDSDLMVVHSNEPGASQIPGREVENSAKGGTNAMTGRLMSFNSSQLQSFSMKKPSHKAGAAPGLPDTDEAFLKALASTKKGKKREDDFDREFNNLRISKPELDKEVQVDDYAVLADFGEDENIMGNFMVIMEMDVREEGNRAQGKRSEPTNWQGLADFKKFKKKLVSRQRPALELVAADENDFGMGSAYWKGSSSSQSQSQPQGDSQHNNNYLRTSQSQNKGYLQPGPSKAVQSQSIPKSKSRAVSQEPPRRTRSRSRGLQVVSEESVNEIPKRSTRGKVRDSQRIQASGEDQPLFLDTLDEEEESTPNNGEHFDLDMVGLDDGLVESAMDDTEVQEAIPVKRTTRKTNTTNNKSTTPPRQKKRPAVLLDDDSDTGVTFKGFGGRKKARAK